MKIKTPYLILFAILLFGFLLRAYRLSEMVGFDFDQEYAAIFAQTVLQVYPIKLIGQGLSVQGLFMGPLYFYYLVPFFAISHLHPIGGFIGSVLLGVMSIAIYFFVFRYMFDTTTGLIAAFLRATLFEKIFHDWAMTPSYSSDIAVLLTWLFFYKYWQGDYKYLVPLGFVFGMYTSFHPVHFPLYLVFLAIVLIRRKIPSFKLLILSIIAFIIPLMPLILFEYFHNFLEIKLLFSLKKTSTAEVKNISTLIEYVGIMFHYPTYVLGIFVPSALKNLVSLVVWGGIVTLMLKKVEIFKESFHQIALPLTASIFLLYYWFLPTHVPEYYFIGAEIFFLIYSIITIRFILKKVPLGGMLILVFIFISNFFTLYTHWQEPNKVSLYNKVAIIKKIAELEPDNKMNLYYDTDAGQQYGLGYLQRLYHIDAKGGEKVKTYIIVIPKSRIPATLDIKSGDVGLVIKKD